MIEEGEDASAFDSFTLEDAGGEKKAPSPPKEEASESSEPAESSKTAPPTKSEPVPEETESSGGKLQSALDRIPNASAKAVRLAIESGVKITGIKGTGTGGQITEADVKKAASGSPAVSGSAPGPVASYTDIPISSMRKTIASRLTESFNTNPHYFVAATVSVSKLLKLRQALNTSANGEYKLSVNDFLIKACGVACKKVPAVNSSWRDGFIRQHNNVDISVSYVKWFTSDIY
jgi:pyruvate dehydrogenase E2 component (dihydrolipoamide acetyltransferase)